MYVVRKSKYLSSVYTFLILFQVKHVLGTEEVLRVFPKIVRQTCGSMFKKRKQESQKVTCTGGEQGKTMMSQVWERLQGIFLGVIHYLWGTEDSDLTIEEKVCF